MFKTTKKPVWLISLLILVMLGFSLSMCRKITIREATTDQVNILQYLEQDSLHRFTDLVEIIHKTGFDAFMNAYGTYTLFAPTDSAIHLWLKNKSIDNVPVDSLKAMLKFHILETEEFTENFTDGKLPSVTMYGQFLVTGVQNINGASHFVVNRQATITQANIVTGNGIIQVIDHVLVPAKYSLAKMIENNPDYSIFTQALKATGFYDTLNIAMEDTSHVWFTVFAEPDNVYNDTGVYSFDDLKARYSNTGNPANPKDSLYLYVAYHILSGPLYLADIIASNSHSTLAPLQVITDKLVNDSTILINDDQYSTINGIVHEPGVVVDRAGSDRSATNGVLHNLLGPLFIKVRKPFPIYWDLCATQPELTRLTTIYRNQTFLFPHGAFKNIQWQQSCLKYRANVKGYLGDYWQIGLGTSSSNTDHLGTCESNSWIRFETPLIVAGKYKVWICYYEQNKSKRVSVQVSFDSIPLTSALVQFDKKISSVSNSQADALEAIGWKWWAGENHKSGSTSARMVGIIDVKKTGHHVIRFDLVSGMNPDCNLDMIQFIPVGMNQLVPRFNPDGSIEY